MAGAPPPPKAHGEARGQGRAEVRGGKRGRRGERGMTATPRVLIVGFMGAGKTTAARALARLLGCGALDLDEFITAREGRTPQQLIDSEGEAAFRAKETAALRAALEASGARVIAAGGGAWAVGVNRALAGEHGCLTIWLDVPFDLCWRRIATDSAADERPLARDRGRARSLYEARRGLYALALARVEAGEETSAAEVAAEMFKLTERFADPAAGGAKRCREVQE